MTWLIHNFVTGEDEPLPQRDNSGPSVAWVEGWNCYMHNGLSDNPYSPTSQEAIDWQDGYESAEMD